MSTPSKSYSRYFTYIKPITKIPVVKNYGSTVFTLLIITIFIFYAIKPTVETILVLQKKLENSTQVLEKVNQKAINLSQGKQNYENLDPGIKSKIEAAMPDNADLKSLIQTLEQTAKTHAASVSALQIQPLVIEPKIENHLGTLTNIAFTFNTEGEYKNLVLLLQDLKTSLRLISIESISLSKTTEGIGLIMTLSGKAYYIK